METREQANQDSGTPEEKIRAEIQTIEERLTRMYEAGTAVKEGIHFMDTYVGLPPDWLDFVGDAEEVLGLTPEATVRLQELFKNLFATTLIEPGHEEEVQELIELKRRFDEEWKKRKLH